MTAVDDTPDRQYECALTALEAHASSAPLVLVVFLLIGEGLPITVDDHRGMREGAFCPST